jgi:hypothetical protein
MPTNTYVALRKETVASATDTITFDLTGITGYNDLVIAGDYKTATANLDVRMRFNSDTSTNYSSYYIAGNTGVSLGQSNTSTYIGGYWTIGTSTNSNASIIHISNYNKTTTFKSVLHRVSSAEKEVVATTGLWRNTAAITSVTVYSNGNFAVGSTFSLYGISEEGVTPAPKATGGTIYSDANYYYHAFGVSGLFTPSQALTVDYLVIAGGGGGSTNEAGGGGAGGLRSTLTATGGLGSLETPLSLSSGTQYTVTIGGGGNAAGTNGVQGSNSVFASITSTGGGGGGNGGVAATSGGSGGGGGAYGSNAGGARTASPVQGFAGGSGSFVNGGAGGGGGAGAVGMNGSGTYAGNGGVGLQLVAFSTATGTGVNNYYAGGGGGGAFTGSTQSTGGLGGGGNGGAGTPTTGSSAQANTGGGGGGGGTGGAIVGGNGGSGLVVIRYEK